MADLITRGTIVANVRTLLDDDAYSATTITTAANWFQDSLANDYRLRRLEASETLSAIQGDTTLDFPDDLQTILSFYLTVPQVYDLMKFQEAYEDFMRNFPNFASANQGQAAQWTDFGNAARFARPLNAAHTFQLDYLRVPDHVDNNDSSEFEFNSNWEELFSKGTYIRVMEINEDYAEAANERKNLEPLLTSFVAREGRGMIKTGPIVMRTNRRRGGGRPGLVRDY